MPSELPVLRLANVSLWRKWLSVEGSTSKGVMLTCVRRDSPPDAPTTITYEAALDEALCQGWIDSGGRRLDSTLRLCRFTPRKPKGLWSQRNVGYIARLEKEGRMQPAGRAAVDAAKADGRWDSAYSGSGTAEPHPDFLAALEKVPAAQTTWNSLNKGSRWHIYFTLLNLKTEAGREKRIRGFVDMLARGESPIPSTNKKADKTTDVSRKASKRPASPEELGQTSPAHRPAKTRSGRSIPSYREKE